MSVVHEHSEASFAMMAFAFMQLQAMQIDTSHFHASSDPMKKLRIILQKARFRVRRR